MKRKDAHRPSAINPEEYNFIACDYLGGGLESIAFAEERNAFRAHMTQTGGKYAAHYNSGSCHICGARALYVARFHHTTTNTYITTGMDCAEKLGIGEPILFRNFRARVKEGLKTRKGKLKAQEILGLLNLSNAWDIYARQSDPGDIIRNEEATVIDIVHKVVQYGQMSERQAGYLGKLLDKIEARPALEAKRAAEAAAAAPVPQVEGRMTVVGVVLTTRVDEGQFGAVTKMLVQHATGYKLWGTMPSELAGASVKGCTVEFDARVTRSDKDEKFGFFSRPTKASVISRPEGEA